MKKHIRKSLALIVERAKFLSGYMDSCDDEEIKREVRAIEDDIVEAAESLTKSLESSKNENDRYIAILDTSIGPEVIINDNGLPRLFTTAKEAREHAHGESGGTPVRIFPWKAN